MRAGIALTLVVGCGDGATTDSPAPTPTETDPGPPPLRETVVTGTWVGSCVDDLIASTTTGGAFGYTTYECTLTLSEDLNGVVTGTWDYTRTVPDPAVGSGAVQGTHEGQDLKVGGTIQDLGANVYFDLDVDGPSAVGALIVEPQPTGTNLFIPCTFVLTSTST